MSVVAVRAARGPICAIECQQQTPDQCAALLACDKGGIEWVNSGAAD